MEQRFETFTVLIGKISRNIKRMKALQMAQMDLKGPHVSCLYYLYRSGPLTAAELCDRCEEDKGAVSRSLDFLERNGYVICQSGSGKKYKSLLSLTPKGQQTGLEISQRIEGILEQASLGLTAQEREMMYVALEKISANLEKLTESERK